MSDGEQPPEQSTNSGDERGSERARTLSGLDLAVDHRAVESLIPYARNARTHSDAQVAQIAASIRAFGWTNPILVDGTTESSPDTGACLRRESSGSAPCR